MPAALHALPGARLGPALLLAQRLHCPRQLRDGGDVDHQHPAGDKRLGDGVENLPRRQHVEHHAVHFRTGVVGDVGDDQVPVGRTLTEERRDVAGGVLGVVVAYLVGRHPPLGPDGAQQRARQRPGTGTGLQHPRAREDVALVHDLGGVLGVDDLCAARHRHHVIDEQRPQHEELVAAGGLDHTALRQPDDGVERDRRRDGCGTPRLASTPSCNAGPSRR